MSIQLLFVIPAACNDGTECSEIMKEAYNSVVLNDLSVKWIKEADVNISTRETFVILQAFEGECFQKLANIKSIRILSPLCLLQCITQFKSIPHSEVPLISLALENCIIVCSSLSKDVKNDVKHKVESMAGHFSADLVTNTTYLITNSVRSEKYNVAASLNMKIMNVSFIETLWETSKARVTHASRQEYQNAKYKCAVFANLRVCCTGFAKNDTQVAALVMQHGGRFSTVMDLSNTDVLVCKFDAATSTKFKAAIRRKIDCVTIDWVLDSVAKGYAQRTATYAVKMATSTPVGDDSSMPYISQVSVVDGAPSQLDKSCIDELTDVAEALPESVTENAANVTVLSTFSDLKFVVLNYSPTEKDYIVGMIKQAQGKVMGAECAAADYVIVPVSGAEVQSDGVTVVTHLWVTDCIEQRRLITDPDYYHLPCPARSDVLRGLCICTSGLSRCEREFLTHVVHQLGGVLQDWLARQAIAEKHTLATTHLIASEPAGRKYEGALKWGLHVVYKNWLLGCVKEGRRLPEAEFSVTSASAPKTAELGPDTGGIPTVEVLASPKKRKLYQESDGSQGCDAPALNTSVGSKRKQWLSDVPSLMKQHSRPLSEIKRRSWAKYEECSLALRRNERSKVGNLPDLAKLPEESQSVASRAVSLNEMENTAFTEQLNEFEAHLMSLADSHPKRRSVKTPKLTPNSSYIRESLSPKMSVGWDDNMVIPSPSKPTQPEETPRKFMLSNVKMADRALLVAKLEALGATVSALSCFDSSATHLLCEKLQRNEKMLASMARGLWILHVSYVEDSRAGGGFLDEENYEFGNPKTLDRIQLEDGLQSRALAAYTWRETIARRGDQAFHGVRALVFASNREAMVRVLQAGGATILEASPPFENVNATHCFLELKNNNMAPYIPLAQQGILCLNTIYVNDFLYYHVRDPNEFIIPSLRKYY